MTSRGGQVWDLLVVGGGTAGLIAAKTAAGFGASVLLVEQARTGGDCLWTGCVPSKALISAAAAAADARAAHRQGVHTGSVRVDFPAVMAHVQASITTIAPIDSPQTLRQAGVAVLTATAMFTGPDRADLGGVPVRFRQAVLATGAAPALPPIPGLTEAAALTSESLWEISALPERLLILGGGSIGCELGQAFARLGSQVTLVEAADRVLPREDPDASELARQSLAADGVHLLLGSPVAALEAGSARLEDGRTAPYDQVLVALGRRPRTEGLGLRSAGVELDEQGFARVDRHLRTTNPRIWAAGDVTNHPQLTHAAGVNAALAATNAILGLRRRVDTTTVPRVTFTDPEVAAVGVRTGPHPPPGLRVVTWQHKHVDRAVVEAHTVGFTRLVLDRKSRIVGATVVGPRAGETLTELTLAIRGGLRTRDLAATTHPYPTYADGVWNAAIDDVRRSLRAPAAASGITTLRRLRRAWLRARTPR